MRQHQQGLVVGGQFAPGTQACPVGLQQVSQESQGALGQRDSAGVGEQQSPRLDLGLVTL
jgi:hypothetical protein